MDSNEFLTAAYKANPEFLEKTAQALLILEQWEPTFAAELAADIEAITTTTMEKVASFGNTVLKGAGAVAAAVSIGVGTAVAGDLYDAAKRGLTKGSNLRNILIQHPNLRLGDKKVLLDSFTTLHRYAPEFTADPVLGGQLLHRMIELPHDQHNLIKDLLASRKVLTDAKKNQFSLGKVDFADKEDRNKKLTFVQKRTEALEDAQVQREVKEWEKANTRSYSPGY